jgi:dihydrofolate reductase
MSKLILWNLMTLDGYFEGVKSWQLDFHQQALNEEFFTFATEQLQTADALIFGRVTYEGMAAYWPNATDKIAGMMNSLPKVVFSRTLESATWNNSRLIRDEAIAAVVSLKQQTKQNIFVFGSADLSAQFLDANLFDEIRLCIVPVLQGEGNLLFRKGIHRKRFKLEEARPLKNGCIITRYTPEPVAS